MTSIPERKLLKGSLKAPSVKPLNTSYTQLPTSKDEISVRQGKDKGIIGDCNFIAGTDIMLIVLVHEFSSQAVPQPFLNPNILQQRVQVENQSQMDREKTTKRGVNSSSSQGI